MELLGKERKMSVKEVAAVLGYDRDYLRKVIKERLPEIVENGKQTYMTEKNVTELKKYLVPRTLDMKIQGENAVTRHEEDEAIASAMLILKRRSEEYKARAEIAENKLIQEQPKIDFANMALESASCIDMGQAAKVLNAGYGRNKLFEKLRELKILNYKNIPYQNFIDAGYFRLIEVSHLEHGKPVITTKTLVYQKGLDYINKKIKAGK